MKILKKSILYAFLLLMTTVALALADKPYKPDYTCVPNKDLIPWGVVKCLDVDACNRMWSTIGAKCSSITNDYNRHFCATTMVPIFKYVASDGKTYGCTLN